MLLHHLPLERIGSYSRRGGNIESEGVLGAGRDGDPGSNIRPVGSPCGVVLGILGAQVVSIRSTVRPRGCSRILHGDGDCIRLAGSHG